MGIRPSAATLLTLPAAEDSSLQLPLSGVGVTGVTEAWIWDQSEASLIMLYSGEPPIHLPKCFCIDLYKSTQKQINYTNTSKEKETIYYILKTTYNVSHRTTIYCISSCVTLGLVIYLLYILSYREREGTQTFFLFEVFLIFLQLKKIDHWLYKTKVETHKEKKCG